MSLTIVNVINAVFVYDSGIKAENAVLIYDSGTKAVNAVNAVLVRQLRP